MDQSNAYMLASNLVAASFGISEDPDPQEQPNTKPEEASETPPDFTGDSERIEVFTLTSTVRPFAHRASSKPGQVGEALGALVKEWRSENVPMDVACDLHMHFDEVRKTMRVCADELVHALSAQAPEPKPGGWYREFVRLGEACEICGNSGEETKCAGEDEGFTPCHFPREQSEMRTMLNLLRDLLHERAASKGHVCESCPAKPALPEEALLKRLRETAYATGHVHIHGMLDNSPADSRCCRCKAADLIESLSSEKAAMQAERDKAEIQLEEIHFDRETFQAEIDDAENRMATLTEERDEAIEFGKVRLAAYVSITAENDRLGSEIDALRARIEKVRAMIADQKNATFIYGYDVLAILDAETDEAKGKEVAVEPQAEARCAYTDPQYSAWQSAHHGPCNKPRESSQHRHVGTGEHSEGINCHPFVAPAPPVSDAEARKVGHRYYATLTGVKQNELPDVAVAAMRTALTEFLQARGM
jgi:hypothetical protein